MVMGTKFRVTIAVMGFVTSLASMHADEPAAPEKETSESQSPIIKPLQSIVIKKRSVVVRASDFETPAEVKNKKWDVNITSEYSSVGGVGYGIRAEGPLTDRMRAFVSHREGLAQDYGMLGPQYGTGSESKAEVQYEGERTKIRVGVEKSSMHMDCSGGALPSLCGFPHPNGYIY